jgi:uncharacterized protein YdaU (DUF1376 family)
MKLRGMTWWIDRWRQSTAVVDLSLEEQGAYRNLLDEAWLRGGAIPDDPRVLARASGDAVRWPKIQAKVMARFGLNRGEWRHETIDELIAKANENANRQRVYREKVTRLSHVTSGANRNRNRNQ